MAGTNTLDLSKMKADEVAAIVAQVAAHQKAEQDAVKASLDARATKDKAFTSEVGTRIVQEYLPEYLTEFSSGAKGVLVAGTKVTVEGVEYTIGSVLVRVTSTIPPKEATKK